MDKIKKHTKTKVGVVTVILPFTQPSSVEGFANRIVKLIKKEGIFKDFDESSIFETFTLSDIKQVSKFLRFDNE